MDDNQKTVGVLMPSVDHKMTSLTILELNEDCLVKILSILDDSNSFYSFALTCKRFHQVSSSNARYWHLKVLKTKAEFNLKKFIVLNCRFELENSLDELTELKDLLQNASKCSESIESKLREVQDVWDTCGPVAAKLFTLIESLEEQTHSNAPLIEGTTVERFLVLELPKYKEEFYINMLIYVDFTGSFENNVNVLVACKEDSGLQIDETISVTLLAENLRELSEEEIQRLAQPFKPVVALLQSELGDANLQMTDFFIVWFFFFFLSKPVVELAEDKKLYFSDNAKNQRPTMSDTQKFSNKKDFSKFGEKWRQEAEEAERPKIIVDLLENLVHRKAKKTIETLREDSILFYDILSNYDFRKFSQEIMLDLFTRTRILSCTSTIAADKKVDSYAKFMLNGGKAMAIEGNLIERDGGFDISFKFESPGNFMIEILETKEYAGEPSDDERQTFTEKFQPITKLLQECINESMKDCDKACPMITDIFTVIYFMWVLRMEAAKVSFVGFFYDIVIPETDDEDDED